MDLDRYVPALLNFISNRLTSSGSATYRRRFGLGYMDYRLLAMLSIEPGVSGTRAAEVIHLDLAAVSRTLNSLEGRGLVTAVAGYGRTRCWTLTAEGERIYAAAWEVGRERERRLLADLTAEEQETFRELLVRVRQASRDLDSLATQGPTHKT
jgi:DNA-binding MarR family transcriptional regulator